MRVGVTIDKGILFSGTNHNLLVAVNATTGALNGKQMSRRELSENLVTDGGVLATPLVFAGKVITGESNGDCGKCASSRGLVRAFDETTGNLILTLHTVPPARVNATNQIGYQNSTGGDTWGTNGTNGCACSGGAVWNLPACRS